MTPPAAPPDAGGEEEPRRFTRYDDRSRRDEDIDPDEETIFQGLRTIEPWELALFLGAIITSLLIWLVFIWVHRGTPAG